MEFKLFIDDVREPPDDTWVLARNCSEAELLVDDLGMPTMMSLDHDLGDGESVMSFLKWLVDVHYEAGPPAYVVHSANPVGRDNIVAYMESWRRSL